MHYPLPLKNLIELLSSFPTVGPKTAERYAFYLWKQSDEYLQTLAQLIAELKEKTTICTKCHSIAETDPCHICSDTSRKKSILNVLANTRDMLIFEATGKYNGLYHVLGGVINTLEGVKPEELNIKNLLFRLKKDKISEVILSLSPNLDGETTSMYLSKIIKANYPKIKISRLAKGLAMGSELAYADEQSLANALRYRNIL